ncbi:MAG: hypothetical protein BGO07_02715 [Alphaproteobacteria bacterium 40-19]|nr:MAG: hypothetical protein BGO07_02715 [Alphaproteobacteria bacterium 40-19]
MKKFLLSALFALSLFQSTASAQDYTVSVELIDPNNQLFGYNATVTEVADPIEFGNLCLHQYYASIQHLNVQSQNLMIDGMKFKEFVRLNDPVIWAVTGLAEKIRVGQVFQMPANEGIHPWGHCLITANIAEGNLDYRYNVPNQANPVSVGLRMRITRNPDNN